MIMKCVICGRKLKHPKSRERGYGPICYKRIFGSRQHQRRTQKNSNRKTDIITYYDIPGQITIEEYIQTIMK